MTQRVLILCQRKSSTLPQDKDKVDKTVDFINTYMGENLGEDVDIEYLTTHANHPDHNVDETNYYADYKFSLNNNREAISFVAKHKGVYDGIILNTCPLNYLNYAMIYALLKPDGFLLLKTFDENDETGELGLEEITIFPSTLKTLNKYFKHSAPHTYGSHFYIKKAQAGKKTMRRKVKRSRVKRRRAINTVRRVN
jgi:hypothetical protein